MNIINRSFLAQLEVKFLRRRCVWETLCSLDALPWTKVEDVPVPLSRSGLLRHGESRDNHQNCLQQFIPYAAPLNLLASTFVCQVMQALCADIASDLP